MLYPSELQPRVMTAASLPACMTIFTQVLAWFVSGVIYRAVVHWPAMRREHAIR